MRYIFNVPGTYGDSFESLYATEVDAQDVQSAIAKAKPQLYTAFPDWHYLSMYQSVEDGYILIGTVHPIGKSGVELKPVSIYIDYSDEEMMEDVFRVIGEHRNKVEQEDPNDYDL